MAEGNDNSIAALYLELGLDISQLESDFLAADRTVQQNLNRIRNENTLIRLRTQVEINGLDEASDATRILELREQALNRQMELQRDRIRLTAAALQELTNRRGEDSEETQRMAIRLERERLALQRLEEQLNQVNEARENLNSAGEEIDIGGFEELASGILEKIPPQVKAVGTAVIGVSAAMATACMATKELIEKWRELQNTAYNLNMSVNDTENFIRHMKLAGGEIEDFMGFVRGISDAMVKGEYDDPEAIVFRKYGETAFDINGRIKNFQELSEAIKRMYDKAKAAGEEIEFLQLLGGESGVTDAIQYLERWNEAKEDAAKIFKAGLNPIEMHDAERALNLLTMQMGEFKDALVDVITPATNEAFKGLFEVFRAGTEIISDNKDELREWASAFLKATAQAIGGKPLADLLFSEDPNALDAHTRQVLKAQDDLNRKYAAQKAYLEGDPTTQYGWQRLNDLKDEIADINAEIEHFNQDYDLSIAQLELWRERAYRQNDLSKKERQAIEENFSAQLEQIEQERAQAIKDIREDVDAELGSDLDQQLLDFQRQKRDWISAGMDAAEAEILAEKLKADAIETLEEEFAEARDALRKTDLENQLDAIDKAKDAWIDKGVTEAAAEKLAEEQKAQAIEEFNEEAASKLGSIWQTSLEQRLAQIEREKQAWIDKGVEEVKATQWAEQAKVDAQRDAAMSVLKSQLEEYRAYRYGGYEGLMEYRFNELLQQGIRPEDLQMTPQQLAAFQKAQDTVERNLLPNFATDYDRAENNRLLNNMIVEKQRLQREELEKIAAGITIDGKQVQITPEVEADFGLLSQDRLDEMYQPINQTAESFQTLVPQLEGATEKIGEMNTAITQFSAVEQPTPTDIPAPATPELDTSGLTQPVADITEKFVALSPALDDLSGKITDLGTIISEAIENIPQVEPPAVEAPDLSVDTSQIFSALEELVSPMNEVNSRFGEMSNRLTEVTSGLSELVGALNNLQLSNQNQVESRQANIPPPNITVTVQIEEAHAWDSKHIQELADKVADKITPELTRAIGGDSNGY